MWKFCLIGTVAAATASSSYALPNYGTPAPTPRVGGKGKAAAPYGCPMVMCAEPGYCPTALETPTVNGCPSCPRCPCRCGESCTMFGGGSGVCQTDGACAVNIQAPQCSRGCETVRCTSSTTCILGQCVPNSPRVCTQEVKVCPDGSSVGRTGPNCEFAPCPTGGVLCPQDVQTCPDGSYVGREPPSCSFKPCPSDGVVCTQDAKICPDGSTVGRTGPNCEFAPCPTRGGKGCTREVRSCPDGSSVGRSGPNCEFAPCPSSGSCVCGTTCRGARGAQGYCQANGKCNVNRKQAPVCGGANAASCAAILCLTGTTCRNGQCIPY